MAMTVLIVEDDPLIAMDIQMVLGDAGHQIIGPVSTVAEALRLAAEHAPDCACLDYNLRDNETSLPIAEWLQERGIPFVFLTGLPQQVRMRASCVDKSILSEPSALQYVIETLH